MRKSRADHVGEAWLVWCREHADGLPLPIRRTWWHGDVAHLRFRGAHAALHFSALRDGTVVTTVYHNGKTWDSLHDLDVMAVRDPEGVWYCSLCEPGNRVAYESRHELWAQHVFEPWAECMRELFRPDAWVVLSKTRGATWAKVCSSRDVPDCRRDESCVAAFRACGPVAAMMRCETARRR